MPIGSKAKPVWRGWRGTVVAGRRAAVWDFGLL